IKMYRGKITLILAVVFTLIWSFATQRNSPSNSHAQETVSVFLPGDIILGGLFPVHEKGDGTPCGPKVYNRGVQRLEAMLYAIDRVNNDPNILPGITIGAHILDTCSRDTYALNQSLQFVRASLNNLDTSAFECSDSSAPQLRKNTSSGPVFGVIGGSYSSVSLQVANLLRLFHIPQISPASTAKTLSDKSRFDLFARTVPPDTFQSVALVDIIKNFNWSYVSTIHSEGSYGKLFVQFFIILICINLFFTVQKGEYGIEAFHKEATERSVCIAAAEKVPSAADDKVFDSIISKLQKKPNARGVVLFTRAEDARRILQAAKRGNLSQPFHWIASDGWGKQQKLLEGLEDIAEGAITVELQSEIIDDFDRYMMQLTPKTNIRNPWFAEYWEDTFNCDLLAILINHNATNKNNTYTFKTNLKTRIKCDDSLRLSEKVGYEQESKTQFVVDAVYAFAHALHNLHNDLCNIQSDQTSEQRRHPHSESVWYRKVSTNSKSQACPDMANYDGKEFYNNYLLNVSFIDLAGSEVKFDRQGDGLARYDILNYQRLENSSGYQYKVIGKWFNGLKLNAEPVVWNKEAEQPTSACSLPCEVGMIKKQQGDTCCWICDSCESYEYVFDEFTCKDCGPGLWPYPDKLSCFALDIQYIRWNSLFSIIPMSIAVFGIAVTIMVIVLFARNHDTPLVRASGRELSYTLLFGILVCYCNTFALIAKPTIGSCVVQRFGIGVGFSIIYSALLTKTNRISRIFHSASKSAQRLKYISPQSQVVITASLIAIQVLITMIWMVVEPPGTRFYYPDRREVILKCKIQDMSFLFSQLYNMILITICTVYAIKTRKIPENFNESKFIGFTMYTTCIIWLAFVPIYFGTGNSYEIQITTLCISISLSASVALVCLYSPKVYILIFHPDKNVRKLTMNSTVYRRSAATGAQGAPSSSGYSRRDLGTTAPTISAVGNTAPSSIRASQNSPKLEEYSNQAPLCHKTSEYSNGEFLAEECESVEP
ncbi:hypothetical protein KR018_001288, partial [Drosophila ironensis]